MRKLTSHVGGIAQQMNIRDGLTELLRQGARKSIPRGASSPDRQSSLQCSRHAAWTDFRQAMICNGLESPGSEEGFARYLARAIALSAWLMPSLGWVVCLSCLRAPRKTSFLEILLFIDQLLTQRVRA